MDANRTIPAFELKSELARFCLPAANRDPNRKLAWVNSICILFLLIGMVGAKSGSISMKKPPPLEEPIPVLIRAAAAAAAHENRATAGTSRPGKAGNATGRGGHAGIAGHQFFRAHHRQCGGSEWRRRRAAHQSHETGRAASQSRPTILDNTGSGGERPAPPYPKIAQDQGEQGVGDHSDNRGRGGHRHLR